MAKNFTIADTDLRNLIKVEKVTTSGQYISTCPFCGKPDHFYINVKTQQWDCKKCGESGGIYKLLRHLGATYLIGNKSIEKTDVIKSIRTEENEQEQAANDQEIDSLPVKKLPAGWKLVFGNKYLDSRRIKRSDVKRYQIGMTTISERYQNYIILPIYDNGKIRGFIGRYAGKHVPEDKLRYNNSRHTDFAKLLFGYDDIVEGETDTVILTEGIFDKIAVDKHFRLFDDDTVRCCATFGKKVSDDQIKKLMLKKVRRVILLHDYDALKEIRHNGLKLDNFFDTKIAVCTTKKDIDECTRDEAIEVFQNLKSPKEFNVSVIGKLKR